MGWTPDVMWKMKLRDLLTSYDSRQLYDWDHTAAKLSSAYNNALLVRSSMAKTRAKPKSMIDFHPFRRKHSRGMKITPQNIGVLKQLGGLICGGR